MSIYAANPGGLPHVSPWLVEPANKSLQTRNGDGEHRPFCGGHACSNRIAITASFRSQCADENSALERVCRHVSRLCSGTASGLFLPGGSRSSASRSAPLRGHGSSQNKFENHGNERRAIFFRAPPRRQTVGLGSRAHFALWCPDQDREIHKRRHCHVPE
jgi:hypothetical protein